jgi:hypothetical protein
MSLFNYKGLTVSVLNNGGKEEVEFIMAETPNPIKYISGDRVEFMYGGGKFIYQIKGINFDTISGVNMVFADVIFVNLMPDGSQVVIKNHSFNYSVSPMQFEGMSTLQSLPNSTILKTMFMHLVNGLLARIPELGGTHYGGGMEYFNNDGSVTVPLYTYKLVQVNGKLDLTVEPLDVASDWKLLLNGEEYLKAVETQAVDDAGEITTTTTYEQSLTIEGLEHGFYQIEYQVLDEAGEVVQSQPRNIIL